MNHKISTKKKHSYSALLASIETIRLKNRDIGLMGVIVFLYICENEGMSVKELAYHCGASDASISRSIQALRLPTSRSGKASHNGLVHVFQNPDDGRRHLVFLTEHGQRLRDEIGALLTAQSNVAQSTNA